MVRFKTCVPNLILLTIKILRFFIVWEVTTGVYCELKSHHKSTETLIIRDKTLSVRSSQYDQCTVKGLRVLTPQELITYFGVIGFELCTRTNLPSEFLEFSTIKTYD